jgi:mono/diheme cytochrome c family protein
MRANTRGIRSWALAGAALAAALGAAGYADTLRAAAAATEVTAPVRAENFRLVDDASKAHELHYYKDARAIVLVAHETDSQVVPAVAPALRALAGAEAGVRVFAIDASADRALVLEGAEMLSPSIPVLHDDTRLIAESLGLTRAGAAVVIDPRTWTVVHRGPVDAALADAVEALSAGRNVAFTEVKLTTPVLRAFAADADEAEPVSYAAHVAPILQKNCVACHSEGGIAPFAMNSYEMARGFAPMIREVIRTDRMPPYNADPHVGDFRNSMNLSVEDARTLVRWVEAGAPRGEGDDPLKAMATKAADWPLGEPDLILTLPAHDVPASGVVDYKYLPIANPLTEGRWLKATTINVGDRQAVHHLLSPVGDYAVGEETTLFPEKGKEPEYIARSIVLAKPGIEIPAGAARHEEAAYITFPQDATIYALFPHAHYRGENAAISILRPGASQEVLVLSLPKYDFSWQRNYYFEEPLKVEAGTKIIARYQYDNSANNPANPDPSETVRWGEQSWEEMHYTAIMYRFDGETAANQRPDYVAELNASRTLGVFDADFDGRLAKSELTGRFALAFAGMFDKLDLDKDGYLSQAEMKPLAERFGDRISQAAEDGVRTAR